ARQPAGGGRLRMERRGPDDGKRPLVCCLVSSCIQMRMHGLARQGANRSDSVRSPCSNGGGRGPIPSFHRAGASPEAGPGLAAEKLMDEEIYPVCSPGLPGRRERLRKPEALSHETLIHDLSMDGRTGFPTWETWL